MYYINLAFSVLFVSIQNVIFYHFIQGEIKEEHIATLSSRSESANLAHWQASGVSRLFGLMLKKYWPEGSDGREPSQDEILRHVFSWKPMAQYFEYFASKLHVGVH